MAAEALVTQAIQYRVVLLGSFLVVQDMDTGRVDTAVELNTADTVLVEEVMVRVDTAVALNTADTVMVEEVTVTVATAANLARSTPAMTNVVAL